MTRHLEGGSAAKDGRRVRGAHVDQGGMGRPAPVGWVGALARCAGATPVFVVLQGGRWRCFQQQQQQQPQHWAREIAARLDVRLDVLVHVVGPPI